MAGQDDFLERGFELAYFIFPERSIAISILTGAMNKLKTQRERESRRVYWRDKHLKLGITRITRDEGDTLQWLIFFESDPHEKNQENRARQTARDMVVRYVKMLVRAGTAMSSFHVNIGLQRLLHSYSTSEAQRLFEVMTDRYPGADEYRRAKSVLMSKILDRFGGFLTTLRAQYGEVRFEVQDNQERWANLVDTCLVEFTPWSTNRACPVPSNFTAETVKLPPQLSGSDGKTVDPNRLELNRCHAFIHPVCFGRLAQGLNLEPPPRKLAVPRFNMQNNSKDQDSTEGPTSLAPQERESIYASLSHQSARRRNARPASARIVVDGVERVRMPLSRRNERGFVIQEGAELIELWSQDNDADLLLAVHRIAYSQKEGFAPVQTLLFRNHGRRLVMTISPEPETPDQTRRAIVFLRSQPGFATSGLSDMGAAWRWGLAAGSAAIAVMLLGLGWLLGGRMPVRTVAHQQPSPLPSIVRQPEPAQAAPQPPRKVETARVYRMVPDEFVTRGDQGPQYPVISVPGSRQLVLLELPITADYAHKSLRADLKRFDTPAEILAENMLTARRAGAGWVVDFSVPSGLLQPGRDYTIDLQDHTTGGTLEEVTSYTFHVKQ